MRERRGDGLLNDENLIVRELTMFADQGGQTIWDLTTAELTDGTTQEAHIKPVLSRARDNVEAVARVSARTGINVVLGTGHYREPFIDKETFDRFSVNALAERIAADIEEGFEGTDIRAGIIGEIGADAWYVSALEERSFRAAARASEKTNAPVYTHAARWPVGHAQLDILLEEGMDPSRIVMGHTDMVPDDEYALSLVERGVFVGFDTINSSNRHMLDSAVRRIMLLVRADYLDRILLSHDVCLTSQLVTFGGNGYTFVLSTVKEMLLSQGLTSEEFTKITVDNPARILIGD